MSRWHLSTTSIGESCQAQAPTRLLSAEAEQLKPLHVCLRKIVLVSLETQLDQVTRFEQTAMKSLLPGSEWCCGLLHQLVVGFLLSIVAKADSVRSN